MCLHFIIRCSWGRQLSSSYPWCPCIGCGKGSFGSDGVVPMETNERVDYACLQVTLISPFFDPLFLLSSGSNGDTLPLYSQSWGHKWEERSWSWRVGSSNPNLGHLFILLFRWFGVQEYSKGPCRDLPWVSDTPHFQGNKGHLVHQGKWMITQKQNKNKDFLK